MLCLLLGSARASPLNALVSSCLCYEVCVRVRHPQHKPWCRPKKQLYKHHPPVPWFSVHHISAGMMPAKRWEDLIQSCCEGPLGASKLQSKTAPLENHYWKWSLIIFKQRIRSRQPHAVDIWKQIIINTYTYIPLRIKRVPWGPRFYRYNMGT